MRRISFVMTVLLFFGCLHTPQAVEEPATDIQGFIEIFEFYEDRCPYFAHKSMDWKKIGAAYYPMAADCQNEDELINVIIEMLAEIQDPAICLYRVDDFRTTVKTVYPYIQEYKKNYNMDVLVDEYLNPNGWAGWEDGYIEGFGWCDPAILPYFFLDTIPGSSIEVLNSLDRFIAECIELDVLAIIIDVRMNPFGVYGVYGECGHKLMGRFAAKTYASAIYRSRLGPEYDQYRDIRPAVFKAGPAQYTGTVILLAGEHCNDKSENMIANFINFPNVVLVGDTTRGSVSRLGSMMVSDNWSCTYVYETILTYDHHWIEGAGIPPDIYVEASDADFEAGVDPVLEYAMDMLVDCR